MKTNRTGKDRIKSKLDNLFPNNPTQTSYLRFLRTPEGQLKTMWSDATEKFNRRMEAGIKTAYSDLLEGHDGRRD